MRIIIVGPPRSGNLWLKCLLANTYRLTKLHHIPKTEQALDEKIRNGWFIDNSIFHQHFEPTPEFLQIAQTMKAKLVTIIRDPYDAFVSLYFFVQNVPDQFGPDHHLFILRDKPIDHPDVLSFLKDEKLGYRVYLKLAYDWIQTNNTVVVRYEDLRQRPLKEMRRLTRKIKWGRPGRIKKAIEHCNIRAMRKRKDVNTKHLRKGEIGDYRNFLHETHYEIFHSYHRDLILKLGYDVFEGESLGDA